MTLWPDVGRDILGLSRPATYQAAATGAIPILRFGRTLRVPTAMLREMLGLDPEGPSVVEKPPSKARTAGEAKAPEGGCRRIVPHPSGRSHSTHHRPQGPGC
jgi:hypothetical protein